MTKSIQIKLLVAILAVLGVIAGLLARGGRPSVVVTPQDQELQKKLAQKTMPSAKRYIVP
jgi:hypothetical protein